MVHQDRTKNPFALIGFFILIGFLVFVGETVSAQEKVKILVGPNILVTREADGNAFELSIASDPTNPKNLFTSSIIDRINPGADNETRGYYSRDGGNTWETVRFPDLVASFSGDSVVAIGKTGTLLFLTIAGSLDSSIASYRSTDGGLTWGRPVVIGRGDHEQIVVDHSNGKFAGNIYVAGACDLPNGRGNGVGVWRSTDDGRSWTGPAEVAANKDFPAAQVASYDPLIFSNGELFASFTVYDVGSTKGAGMNPAVLGYSISSDGGISFSPRRELHIVGTTNTITSPSFPFFAIDNSSGEFKDRLYVVWGDRNGYVGSDGVIRNRPETADARPSKLWISHSSDKGKSWSKPILVTSERPDSSNQFMPSIAVNKQGVVAVTYYDTKDTPPENKGVVMNRYITASIDGGETFLSPVRVSSAPTEPAYIRRKFEGAATDSVTAKITAMRLKGVAVQLKSGASADGHDYHDYLGMTADSDGTFHPFWIDGRNGSSKAYTAQIRIEKPEAKDLGSTPAVDLVETDVSRLVEARLDPVYSSEAGVVGIPIRLRNRSSKPIYGPFRVEVISVAGPIVTPPYLFGDLLQTFTTTILNSSNKETGVGATIDYSTALGNFAALSPGAVTDAIVWKLKEPSKSDEFPILVFKVTARVERTKDESKPDSPAKVN